MKSLYTHTLVIFFYFILQGTQEQCKILHVYKTLLESSKQSNKINNPSTSNSTNKQHVDLTVVRYRKRGGLIAISLF